MLAHTEGPPSEHLTLADLDAATLTLVIPAAGGGEASLWLGEPLPPFVVANALRAVAEEVAPLSAPEGSAYPRGMGEDHRSAETGRYVTDAEAEAHPDTTVTEHDQVHPLVRASRFPDDWNAPFWFAAISLNGFMLPGYKDPRATPDSPPPTIGHNLDDAIDAVRRAIRAQRAAGHPRRADALARDLAELKQTRAKYPRP
jgi:hypothetical protein